MAIFHTCRFAIGQKAKTIRQEEDITSVPVAMFVPNKGIRLSQKIYDSNQASTTKCQLKKNYLHLRKNIEKLDL